VMPPKISSDIVRGDFTFSLLPFHSSLKIAEEIFGG